MIIRASRREYQRRYREKYPEKYRLSNLKSNSSEKWKQWHETHPEKLKEYNDRSYFSGNREKVIQRDGEKCVNCGLTRAEHFTKYGKDITVNHIDGNGKNNLVEKKNNDVTNLETLCLKCHGSKDSVRYHRSIGRNPKEPKKCLYCGITFNPPHIVSIGYWKKRKFCSMNCHLKNLHSDNLH